MVAVLVVALAASSSPTDARGTLHRYEASRESMACTYAIVVYGAGAAALPGIVEAAFDEVDRIDRLMSHYRRDSPLSRVNREAAGGPVAVEPELFDFIAEAVRYSRESGGAFDITVGPLMKAWGFFEGAGRVPGDDEVAALRARVGYQHVVLDASDRTIRFDRPGIELDLGGIAKGYAVDRAIDILRRGRVKAALVSAGGSTIYAMGAPPGRGAWDVTVQNPLDARRRAFTVPLKDRALSVSGRYGKSFDVGGVTYSHIMDPRTGRPVQGLLSVAVLTPTATAGDALDNVLFVQGVDSGRKYLRRVPATEAFFFLPAPRGRWKIVRVGSPQVDDHIRADRRQGEFRRAFPHDVVLEPHAAALRQVGIP